MARQVKRLAPLFVKNVAAAGAHIDGDGLRLIVDESGAKRWSFRFRWSGKEREMGLGSYPAVSLARARELHADARREIAAGRNPIDARREARTVGAADMTFKTVADEIVTSLSAGFRNEKHRAQWKSTLATYAAPIADKSVSEITTADVLAILQPIWTAKPETASRVRGRIERVLDAAKAKGLRSGENPARWRGHLDTLLSKRLKLTRGHHAALPYASVPSFISDLRKRTGLSVLVLEFAILTVARSGEVYGARWSEIDVADKVWTVPAERMKAGRPHRVPLTSRMLAILETAKATAAALRQSGDLVFPGERHGRPLSVMAMAMTLRRMGKADVTVHGFRSAFRDWAGNETHIPREIAEAALAHIVGDKSEQAYRRGDALDKRRALMQAWCDYCAKVNTGANVVPLVRSA